jgi:peptidyl-tRNA hydrolase
MNKGSISMAQLHASSSCSATREKETKREMVKEWQGRAENV